MADVNPYLAHRSKKPKVSPSSTAERPAGRRVDFAAMEDGPENALTGLPLSPKYFEILEKRRMLPVHKQRDDFLQLVRSNQIVILVGETGSGKTTQCVFWRWN
jgi:pre-mRNA-splicing factor ATP-dependent RNA helicase DHX15/PRP43